MILYLKEKINVLLTAADTQLLLSQKNKKRELERAKNVRYSTRRR